MSRFFRMELDLSGHVPQNLDAIKKAAAEEWPFEDWREFAGEGPLPRRLSLRRRR